MRSWVSRPPRDRAARASLGSGAGDEVRQEAGRSASCHHPPHGGRRRRRKRLLDAGQIRPVHQPTSQHATEVEPDTFAAGGTVVATFQVGRFFSGGSTDIGFVRSGNGGKTWGSPGFLPDLTKTSGSSSSPYERVSDPSVSYDSLTKTWLISQ